MEREPSVQVREPCDGCDGSGHVSRWIPLSEFKALLERQPRG